MEKSKEKPPQKQRTSKRNQTKKVKNPENKDKASIVYKSDELEKLMAMSLDDIIDTLPETKDTKEEDDEK